MRGRFPYGTLAKYPHMKPGDVEIWERFLDANPEYFDSVDYDLLVGEGADFDTDLGLPSGGNAQALYKKKVDVVGYRTGEIWLIEIRPRASPLALGQVAVYDELYRDEHKGPDRVVNAVLTDTIMPDVENIAKKWDIILLVA